MDFLSEISDNMKPILSKNKPLLVRLTQALFAVVMDKAKDPMYYDMPSPSQLALLLFSHLAKVLPKKKFYPIMISTIDSFMKTNDHKK